MFYRLKERYSLRGWELLPYAVVDKTSPDPLFINGVEMDALKLCNGKVDFDIPLIPKEIRGVLPRFLEEGIIEECKQGEGMLPEQGYRKYPARCIRSVLWSITGRCNYKCRHCYMSAPDAKYGELSHEETMRIIRELGECGIRDVSLTGGEPLVRKDFLEIVDGLLGQGIHISRIYTNGALVNRELLKALDDRGMHPEFNMSFDGVGWHDWLRGIPGAEKLVDRAFLLCREMGFPTGAEMCIHKGNKDTLRQSVLHLRDVGCRSLKTNPIANIGSWAENGYGESIGIDEVDQLYLDYIPKYYDDGMPLNIQLGGLFMASPRRPDRYIIPEYHHTSDPRQCCICGHARMTMYISPEGRALPCMSLTGMAIQDEFPLVTELGISKCLTDSRYMDFLDTRADRVLEHNPECRDCIWRSWCLGGCRASGLSDSGERDLLYKDEATCKMYSDGLMWRLISLMKEISAEVRTDATDDKEFCSLLEEQWTDDGKRSGNEK